MQGIRIATGNLVSVKQCCAGGREEQGGGQPGRVCSGAKPVKPIVMTILYILEQARRRNAAEDYYLYTQSEEGKAAAEHLACLRAACDEAEAHYLETCARHDAERTVEGRA